MDFSTIKSRIRRNTKTNDTDYLDADIAVDCNVALDRVASLIMRADNRWQFDDQNETDLPIATTALVSGQQDYSLDTAALDINQVAVKGSDGQWRFLRPIDQSDLRNADLNADDDQPLKYDRIANSILLYPTPNYSQDASLRLYFKRGPSYFLSTDTTKTPGFNALFHDLIVLWPSYEYALTNLPTLAPGYFAQIEAKESALSYAYSTRSPQNIRITAKHTNAR